MKITAIIATKGDPLLWNTVKSLWQAGWPANDIMVLSDGDGGDAGPFWPNYRAIAASGAKMVYQPERLGPGPTRHRGALLADDGWIMFCDSHMSFPIGFRKDAEHYLGSSVAGEIWGPVYHSDVIFDSFWHDCHNVAGADFYFWRHHKESGKFSFADLLPRRVQQGWSYHVPCLLGGCYFVHTDWFKQMNGYRALIGYGSEESWLSLSTWLAGGRVSIMGELAVTHHHQKATSSKRPLIPEWESNRIAVIKRVLTPKRYEEFLSWLPIAQQTKDEVDMRCDWINQSFDKSSIDDVAKCYGLQSYDEAIEVMRNHRQLLADIDKKVTV